jgi:hypothetical protein
MRELRLLWTRLDESDADLLCHLDGSATERDALAEALCPPGHCPVPRDADVVPMHLVEQDWRQVVRARAAPGPRSWNNTT